LVEDLYESDCRSAFILEGSGACARLARVFAHFGEHDAAIDLLEEILPAPSWYTVHILEIDPIWDPSVTIPDSGPSWRNTRMTWSIERGVRIQAIVWAISDGHR
jgi:hypothetical protein